MGNGQEILSLTLSSLHKRFPNYLIVWDMTEDDAGDLFRAFFHLPIGRDDIATPASKLRLEVHCLENRDNQLAETEYLRRLIAHLLRFVCRPTGVGDRIKMLPKSFCDPLEYAEGLHEIATIIEYCQIEKTHEFLAYELDRLCHDPNFKKLQKISPDVAGRYKNCYKRWQNYFEFEIKVVKAIEPDQPVPKILEDCFNLEGAQNSGRESKVIRLTNAIQSFASYLGEGEFNFSIGEEMLLTEAC